MSDHARSLMVLVAGVLFVAFLMFKLLPVTGGVGDAAALPRRRMTEARKRASDRSLGARERASALREAAGIALEELGRPGLAASYARRAERLDPESTEVVGLLALTMRRASRLSALERLLWRRVAEGQPESAPAQRAVQELIALYDGPLKRPEVGEALRRLSRTTKT
jgi:hypothetical protein